MFNDSFFNKVEKKTKVKKDTILNVANKLQKSNMKDEKTIRDLIQELCDITGKDISEEKKQKIIKAITNDKVPKVDKMI